MKRIYLSIIMIALIITAVISSHFIIASEEDAISGKIDAVCRYTNESDKENALAEAEKLSLQWEKSRKKLAFFVSDKNLDDIGDSISKIKPLISAGSDEITAETEYVKRKLHRTHAKDIPYVYNIF